MSQESKRVIANLLPVVVQGSSVGGGRGSRRRVEGRETLRAIHHLASKRAVLAANIVCDRSLFVATKFETHAFAGPEGAEMRVRGKRRVVDINVTFKRRIKLDEPMGFQPNSARAGKWLPRHTIAKNSLSFFR